MKNFGQNSMKIVKPKLTKHVLEYLGQYLCYITNLRGSDYCMGVNVGGETSDFCGNRWLIFIESGKSVFVLPER